MEAFTGEIRPFAFNFNPQNWQLCRGQILAISQFSALFSILGTTYGGNGTTTFALPNIQGTVINGVGTLPGGSNYVLGEIAGTADVTLLNTQMPAHNHSFNGGTAVITTLVNAPATGSYLSNSLAKTSPSAPTGTLGRSYGPSSGSPLSLLNPLAVGFSGGNSPHNNMAPYVVINYCICINGIFPTRN
jgi:microcystin-dependent protein